MQRGERGEGWAGRTGLCGLPAATSEWQGPVVGDLAIAWLLARGTGAPAVMFAKFQFLRDSSAFAFSRWRGHDTTTFSATPQGITDHKNLRAIAGMLGASPWM